MALDDVLPKLEPESWEEAKDIVEGMPGWIYRGHADAAWALKTTIERQAARYALSPGQVRVREREMIRRFRARAHQYLTNPPPESDSLSWVSIMQHHGAPTRLLDCTNSFYIAAFFAVVAESTSWEPNAAIWAFDPLGLNEAALGMELTEFSRARVQTEWHRGFNRLMEMQDVTIGVGAVEPTWTTERLAAQQGCFVFPGNLSTSFEENLSENLRKYRERVGEGAEVDDPHTWGCCKIILKPNVFRAILHDLWKMNITSTTLLPGLDGFSRSLGYYLEPTLTV